LTTKKRRSTKERPAECDESILFRVVSTASGRELIVILNHIIKNPDFSIA
jgi:hypothetical protein